LEQIREKTGKLGLPSRTLQIGLSATIGRIRKVREDVKERVLFGYKILIAFPLNPTGVFPGSLEIFGP